MLMYVPDKVKAMSKDELCDKLRIDWVEAERLQKGSHIPEKLRYASPISVAEALDISISEAERMLTPR